MIASLLLAAALSLLPAPTPETPDLGVSVVAKCGANWGVYAREWDTNPASPTAVLQQFGAYELGTNDELELSEPVLVIVVDDDGRITYHTLAGEVSLKDLPDSACDLPGLLPKSEKVTIPRGERA